MKKNINFYARYLAEKKRERGAKNKKLLLLLPLIAALALMAGLAADILIQNFQKTRELNQINAGIDAIQAEYDDAQAIADKASVLSAEYTGLEASDALFRIYPGLDARLFETVKKCAGSAFKLDEYKYAEEDITLIVDAHAPSVDEMPRFVEALRGTGLFSAVTYAGYTSDSNGDYYCTVGCTLKPIIGG